MKGEERGGAGGRATHLEKWGGGNKSRENIGIDQMEPEAARVHKRTGPVHRVI